MVRRNHLPWKALSFWLLFLTAGTIGKTTQASVFTTNARGLQVCGILFYAVSIDGRISKLVEAEVRQTNFNADNLSKANGGAGCTRHPRTQWGGGPYSFVEYQISHADDTYVSVQIQYSNRYAADYTKVYYGDVESVQATGGTTRRYYPAIIDSPPPPPFVATNPPSPPFEQPPPAITSATANVVATSANVVTTSANVVTAATVIPSVATAGPAPLVTSVSTESFDSSASNQPTATSGAAPETMDLAAAPTLLVNTEPGVNSAALINASEPDILLIVGSVVGIVFVVVLIVLAVWLFRRARKTKSENTEISDFGSMTVDAEFDDGNRRSDAMNFPLKTLRTDDPEPYSDSSRTQMIAMSHSSRVLIGMNANTIGSTDMPVTGVGMSSSARKYQYIDIYDADGTSEVTLPSTTYDDVYADVDNEGNLPEGTEVPLNVLQSKSRQGLIYEGVEDDGMYLPVQDAVVVVEEDHYDNNIAVGK